MTKCTYWYHNGMTNMPPRRCANEEGHNGPHLMEQLPTQAQWKPLSGWFKH